MKYKNTPGNVAFNIVNYSIFIVFTVICIFPFYYIFINTVSSNDLVAKGKILFYPIGFHLNNYVEVFKLRGLGQATFISIARTVLGTLATLLGSTFLGYSFSKREYWRRTFWYRFVVVTMYFNAGLIPWFIIMKMLGFVNNFWAYVIPGLVVPFNMILFKTYVEQIPASLEESAQLDGAGYLARLFKIIVPLSIPILATIAVFTSVGQWNSFLDTLFLMTKSNKFTLQFLLYQFLSEAEALARAMRESTASKFQSYDRLKLLTPTSIRMTITIVVTLPILLVYPYMQRFFIKGIMIGSIKG